nr:putative quinol monooxygenase [Ramlibacter alkalitolerans]
MISKLKAEPGQREALMAILLQGTRAMPGCIHYIIGRDTQDERTLWVVETWDSPQAHRSSLALPEVVEAMTRGKPLIAAIEQRVETEPLETTSCS